MRKNSQKLTITIVDMVMEVMVMATDMVITMVKSLKLDDQLIAMFK